MKSEKRHKRRRSQGDDAPELKIVGIDFNPGPDAEERLRRLFIILLKLADDELPSAEADPSPDDGSEEQT